MIDSHAHIYLEEFNQDIEEVINSAIASGVSKILLPNIDRSTTESMLAVVKKFPNVCYPMMGLHPCSVRINYEMELRHVEEMLNKNDCIAVGEMGTDLYWDKSFWNEQKEVFEGQCELALAKQLPIVIHCRESIAETIALVKPWANKGLRGVFHCFTGSLKQAQEIIDLGFYLGLGGASTFKNGGMDRVIPFLNKDHVLLETDSPYLSPVPYRGKRNEPAYLKLVAERIADLWQIALDEADSITMLNTKSLFKL